MVKFKFIQNESKPVFKSEVQFIPKKGLFTTNISEKWSIKDLNPPPLSLCVCSKVKKIKGYRTGPYFKNTYKRLYSIHRCLQFLPLD